jgi:hypothetical protein
MKVLHTRISDVYNFLDLLSLLELLFESEEWYDLDLILELIEKVGR